MIEPNDNQGERKGRNVVLGMLGLAVFVGACQLFLGFGQPSGPVFPHAPHLEELDCTACHEGAEEKATAGFPESERGCMLCHKDIDEKKPFEKTVAAFLVDGKPRWLNRADPYAGDVQFDHGKHFEAELDCAACHEKTLTGEGYNLRIHGGKKDCMACHEKTQRGNACEVCHRVMRKDQAPPDHLVNWKRAHGAHSRRMIAGLGQTTCEQCHVEEESCATCHQREAPINHTHFWRIRGHGVSASMDRNSCITCHQPDYCTACHQNTAPRSHRGAFGPPGNRHCITCHTGTSKTGCAVCHETLPLHTQGNALPGNATHMTARSPVDCLTCHVALKHPNPGLDCRACHK